MGVSRRSLLLGSASAAVIGSTVFGSKGAAAQGADAAPVTVGADPADRRLVVRMIRALYPHDRFGNGPYERTADAVFDAANKTPAQKLAFADGIQDLRSASFEDLDDSAAMEYLKGIEGSAFFATVRGNAVVALYNDQEVWDVLGYEGPSFDKGGYISRGFNDLDWLPEPRITEFGETQ